MESRAYRVEVERGNRVDRWSYLVAAASGAQAIVKAIRQARVDSGFKTGWRVTQLAEQQERIIR